MAEESLKTTTNNEGPKRYIYSMSDMEHFKVSPVKKDLLSFITALGRSTISCSYKFDPLNPLIGLSPGMASLHGSLHTIETTYLKELPPDESLRARFGNPIFKQWHNRLTLRCFNIIKCMMDVHAEYVAPMQESKDWDESILQSCADKGAAAATMDVTQEQVENYESSVDMKQLRVIRELRAYFLHAFGHEVRLDYGTGHECSFYVFLYSLCKIGVFGNIPKTSTPSNDILAPVALSITTQYLQVCRGIQTDYFLEPAGSHGVWGLDDYHCIPFYIGACQMQNEHYAGDYTPSSIHNDTLINSSEGDAMIYFQCIRYIKSLKKNVPFFESSPMLDDISRLNQWSKVSGGLLRLYEGEVLNKKPVIQHFLFGDIFQATWEPSRSSEREAPQHAFNNEVTIAPWALNSSSRGQAAMPPTKAPWAK